MRRRAAAVVAFTLGALIMPAPAPIDAPAAAAVTVHADSWDAAWGACLEAYGYGSETFVDCVNAAAEYFYGPGWRVFTRA